MPRSRRQALLVIVVLSVMSLAALAVGAEPADTTAQAFDTDAQLYGYPALTIAVVLVIVLIVAMSKWGKSVMSPKWAAGVKVLAAVGVIVCAAVMMGVTFTSETASVASYTLEVSASEDTDQSYVTIDNGDHKITWNVHFNYTGDGTFLNTTQYCELNFTLTRIDQSSKDFVVKTYVSDKGSVVDESNGNTYYLVNKGNDWAITWTKAGSTEGDVVTTEGDQNTLKLESGGSAWTTLNMTLRADAIDAMPLYEAEYFYVDFGGQTWSIVVTVINWAGVPPTV